MKNYRDKSYKYINITYQYHMATCETLFFCWCCCFCCWQINHIFTPKTLFFLAKWPEMVQSEFSIFNIKFSILFYNTFFFIWFFFFVFELNLKWKHYFFFFQRYQICMWDHFDTSLISFKIYQIENFRHFFFSTFQIWYGCLVYIMIRD